MVKNPGKKYNPRPEETKHGLTPNEQDFVAAYADPTGDTFLNATQSYKKAYPNTTSMGACQSNSSVKLREPKIKATLREMFDKTDIKDLIMTGMYERCKDPLSRHFQPSAEFVAKVLGDFAPEKQINMNLDSQDREAFYNKVIEQINNKEAKQLPVVPAKPESDV